MPARRFASWYCGGGSAGLSDWTATVRRRGWTWPLHARHHGTALRVPCSQRRAAARRRPLTPRSVTRSQRGSRCDRCRRARTAGRDWGGCDRRSSWSRMNERRRDGELWRRGRWSWTARHTPYNVQLLPAATHIRLARSRPVKIHRRQTVWTHTQRQKLSMRQIRTTLGLLQYNTVFVYFSRRETAAKVT